MGQPYLRYYSSDEPKAGGTTALVVTTQKVTRTSDFTTTSSSLIDVTSLTFTLPDRTGGKVMAQCNFPSRNTGANINKFAWHNGSALNIPNETASTSNAIISISATDDLDGGTLKMQASTTAGTLTMAAGGNKQVWAELLEVS